MPKTSLVSNMATKKDWKIIREGDDPLAERLSIGSPKLEGYEDSGYIVYRGDTARCLEILENALEQFKKHLAEQGE